MLDLLETAFTLSHSSPVCFIYLGDYYIFGDKMIAFSSRDAMHILNSHNKKELLTCIKELKWNLSIITF